MKKYITLWIEYKTFRPSNSHCSLYSIVYNVIKHECNNSLACMPVVLSYIVLEFTSAWVTAATQVSVLGRSQSNSCSQLKVMANESHKSVRGSGKTLPSSNCYS